MGMLTPKQLVLPAILLTHVLKTVTLDTSCEECGLEEGWAVVLSLLPEDCSPGSSEIGSGPSPASLEEGNRSS